MTRSDLSPLWAQFYAIKDSEFTPGRGEYFHYVLYAHMASGGCSPTSRSRGDAPGDTVITLGCEPDQVGTASKQGKALARALKTAISAWE